eukprot:CAMPEP_0195531276 /NCGR_PEP_ID=MMETSP0794_2-20130614/34868_1 /TAXON_ID=515487 /ORGANISM="Stephanopyxis turris, Strain CCMP 815" /LENGTH=318 /DNA_ID=CAMNT_0040663005 /DNA_START=328 /DNA_END=1284 /DNA_ORIENTATION=+
MKDEFGFTPLHRASANSLESSSEKVKALLSAYLTHLAKAKGCLEKGNHFDLTEHNEDPICDKLQKTIALDNIIVTDIKDRSNRTPLQLLCIMNEKWVENALNHTDHITPSILSTRRDYARVFMFWKKACLLVKVSFHGTIAEPLANDQTWRVVHACTGIQKCPFKLLRLAVKLHPEQLRDADEIGNLPLHIAANNLTSSDRNVVDLLLATHPEAAQVFNQNGKLPLHIAAQSCRPWENGTEAILNAFPEAITVVDEETRLYIFMLAAVGENASLNSIYCLLRACPELERFASWDKINTASRREGREPSIGIKRRKTSG